MNNVAFFTLLVLAAGSSFAQPAIPVFKSAQDSLAYEAVTREISRVLEQNKNAPAGKRQHANMDSLFLVQQSILKKGLRGYRYTYYPYDTFYTFEDLQAGIADPMEVDKLSISGYKGKSIPEKVLQCTNLEELQIVNTSISKIQRQLNKLPKLKVIYLENNVPSRKLQLRKNTHVTFLKIRGAHPEKLPRSYRKFIALDSLDLMRNLLEEFPRIQHNKNLRQLVLSENNLTLEKLPHRENHSLENLFLRRNQIRMVPGALEKFTALRKLNLSYNAITEVDARLGKLSQLEQLSLYQNNLTAIPPAVYNMTNLKEIDLYFNAIEKVDPAIRQLQNLRTLYLANNRLVSLPESIGDLKYLQELYLHHNRLSHLPESIGALHSLTILRINNNYFSSFPYSILPLQQLENLDLSHNRIHYMPVEIMSFSDLKMLVLAANPWENKDQIREIARLMREKGATVHTDTYDEPVEDTRP